MANRRKRSPFERFLRRNGLYILIALAVILVAGAVFAVVTQVKRLSPVKTPAQETVISEQAEQTPLEPSTPEESGEEAQQEEPVDESVYVPPFDGQTVLIADGTLVLTFDKDALTMQDEDGLLSLTDKAAAQKARLDVQEISADLSLFKTDELERICIGIVQAYYYLAPETKDFTVTAEAKDGAVFSATVNAPAYDTEAAVTAKVSLWRLDGKSVTVSAVFPEGEDGTAVLEAFSSIEPLGEKHLPEAAQ